jgi:hypothetical protein
MMFLWVLTSIRPVGGYHRLEESYCIHPQTCIYTYWTVEVNQNTDHSQPSNCNSLSPFLTPRPSSVICGCHWNENGAVVHLGSDSMFLLNAYSQLKRFWSLKCVNCNLGATHLPKVCWKGLECRGGRGPGGGKINCLVTLHSFIRWSVCLALPARPGAKNGWGSCRSLHGVRIRRSIILIATNTSNLTILRYFKAWV